MKTVSMYDHNFHKQNLVTIGIKGDLYKCLICKTTGLRKTLAAEIVVSELEYKKSLKCTFVKPIEQSVALPLEILTEKLNFIGLEAGIHKVVSCPDEYKDRFNKDVWVFSEKRGEAVRLFPHEYKIVKK